MVDFGPSPSHSKIVATLLIARVTRRLLRLFLETMLRR